MQGATDDANADDDESLVPDDLIAFLEEHVGGPVVLERYADDEDDKSSFEPMPHDISTSTKGWEQAAAKALQHNGFCVLRPPSALLPVDECAACASGWISRLQCLLELARSAGLQPKQDILRFSEMCSRTKGGLRFDMRLQPGENGPSDTSDDGRSWPKLTAAVQSLVLPVLSLVALEQEGRVDLAASTLSVPRVDSIGCVTSLPGAPDQHFHPDGTAEGLYNAFCPLVPVLADNGPTELRPGSHMWNDSALGSEPRHDLERVLPVAPLTHEPAGSVLLFNYRCYHRGLGNHTMQPRPVAYVCFATRDVTDAHNFPSDRSIADAASVWLEQGSCSMPS